MELLYQEGDLLSILGEFLVLVVGQIVVSLRVQVLTDFCVIIKYSISFVKEGALKTVTLTVGVAEFGRNVQDFVGHLEIQFECH